MRWDVENGVTLCKPCHRLFYKREIEYAELLSVIAATPLTVWTFDE
jgi:hypothetical protein